MAIPLVALVGGDEFRPETVDVDRYILQRLGRARLRAVAVLPTAAAPENAPLAAQHGVHYFRGLGVEALALDDRRRALSKRRATRRGARRRRPRLPGGRRPALSARYAARAPSSGGGSSPCSTRDARSPAPARARWCWARRCITVREWSPALGLLPGICVLPHFQEWGAKVLPDLLAASTERGLTLLAIDGATGCVGWGREWDVVGPGAVTVIRGGTSEVFRSGQRIEL